MSDLFYPAMFVIHVTIQVFLITSANRLSRDGAFGLALAAYVLTLVNAVAIANVGRGAGFW